MTSPPRSACRCSERAPKIPRLKALSDLDTLPPSFQESVRALRTRILLSPIAGAARALAVTSANAGEGKTLIASNLAGSMAAAGRRVLLVDADLRRPQLHQMFNIPISPGLSDVLMGGVDPAEAWVESSFPGLLPAACRCRRGEHERRAGQPTPHSADREIQRPDFDAIVLDCPPVMPVADAAIVANAAGIGAVRRGFRNDQPTGRTGGPRPARRRAGASGWRRDQQSQA